MYLLHEKKELEFNKLLMVGKVKGVGSDPFIEKLLQPLKPNFLRSKVLHYNFYLPKVQTGLEYSAG